MTDQTPKPDSLRGRLLALAKENAAANAQAADGEKENTQRSEDSLVARIEAANAAIRAEMPVGLPERTPTRMPETPSFELPSRQAPAVIIDVPHPIPDLGSYVPKPADSLYGVNIKQPGFLSRHKLGLSTAFLAIATFTAAYCLNDDFKSAVRDAGMNISEKALNGISSLQKSKPFGDFTPQ